MCVRLVALGCLFFISRENVTNERAATVNNLQHLGKVNHLLCFVDLMTL
jgi:hypothetical protein